MVEESRDATKAQNLAFKRAKGWRRKVVHLAIAANRRGEPLPEGLLRITRVQAGPNLAKQVLEMIKLLESSLPRLPQAGGAALFAEGKALYAAMIASDATQEIKRIAELPAAVKRFYSQKGLLFQGLKVINDTGHSLHAEDAAASSRYSLSILYRRAAGAGNGEGTEASVPEAAGTVTPPKV